MAISKGNKKSLGKEISLFPTTQQNKINEIIDAVNDIQDGTSSFDTISELTSGSGVTVDGVILKDTTVDVNGTADAIILDADGDTTISSPTDDQIDIEIAGSDDFTFTANTFTALSGSSIKTDTIDETTGAAGVTVDGVLLKDNAVTATGESSLTGGIQISTNVVEHTTEVTLTASEIVGTGAGSLAHANGAILVAAPTSDYALEFVSATLIYDFDTAAYTGGAGDDLTVYIGSTAVSPAVATADLITAAGDQVVHLRALSAADYDLPVGSAINLQATEVTQPGTAAGVIRAIVTYRVITTGL